MSLDSLVLRTAEHLVRHACRRLPAEISDECYREWTAELPQILLDPTVRSSSRRRMSALWYAADQHRTAQQLAPEGRRAIRIALIGSYRGVWENAKLSCALSILGCIGGSTLIGGGVGSLLAAIAASGAITVLGLLIGLGIGIVGAVTGTFCCICVGVDPHSTAIRAGVSGVAYLLNALLMFVLNGVVSIVFRDSGGRVDVGSALLIFGGVSSGLAVSLFGAYLTVKRYVWMRYWE